MQLSKNFNLDEFLFSQTAARHNIDMTPSALVVDNLKKLTTDILQPLRDGLGCSIKITSGYRPLELNRKIGSKDTSAHVEGRAADIKVNGRTPLEVAEFIEEHFLSSVDQVIHEFGSWVHIGIAPQARSQMLTAKYNADGKAVYLNGLV